MNIGYARDASRYAKVMHAVWRVYHLFLLIFQRCRENNAQPTPCLEIAEQTRGNLGHQLLILLVSVVSKHCKAPCKTL